MPPASPSPTRPALRLRLALAFSVLTVAAYGLLAPTAQAAGRRYQNAALRIADFEIPRGWTQTPASPYPGVLLVATSGVDESSTGPRARADEARLLLAAQRITPGSDASTVAADARALLVKQGFGEVRVTPLGPGTFGEDRARLDAANPKTRRILRQHYVVEGDILVVVTVMLPAARQARVLSEFDVAVESLVLATPANPAPSAPDKDTPASDVPTKAPAKDAPVDSSSSDAPPAPDAGAPDAGPAHGQGSRTPEGGGDSKAPRPSPAG